MSMNQNDPYMKMLEYVNPRNRRPTASDELKKFMSVVDSPGILTMKRNIEEMRQLPETEGYRTITLTVAEFMRLSDDGRLVVETNIQRGSIASHAWQSAVIGSQMLGTMPMAFHICPIKVGYSLIDGAQRLSSLINFFQGVRKTPALANKIRGESGGRMMITGTDTVLEPSTAETMYKSPNQRAMLEKLANTCVTVYVYTPNMNSSGRAYVFLGINDQNELSPGEVLGTYAGWPAVYARRLEENNPFFDTLETKKVDTGKRKETFNELSKMTYLQYQINASDKLLNYDALVGTRPASQGNLKKFAIDNTYDKDETTEIGAAYDGVDRALSYISDVWEGDGTRRTFFGFTSQMKSKGVCIGLSTMYLTALAFQDICGKDWNTPINNNNVAIGVRKAFEQLTMKMSWQTDEFYDDYRKYWNTPVRSDVKGKECTLYNTVKSPDSVDNMRLKLKLITEMLRHPDIAKYLPAPPRDQRRAFTPTDKKRKYEEQGQRCAWSGEMIPLEDCVAHHVLAWSDGGLTEYDNLEMVSDKLHKARKHGTRREAVAA